MKKIPLVSAVCVCAALQAAGTPPGVKVEDCGGAGVFGAAARVTDGPRGAYALCLDGDILYCGGDRSVFVYDVSDARAPRLRSVARGIGAPRQIAAQKGIVYVAARETGVWIVDARDPDRAKTLARFDTVELATGIDVAGDVLFVGQRQNGVEFVDVRDPARPAHIRMEKTSESQSVIYRDGVLYSGDWGAGEVTVFDARDMADVRRTSLVKLRGYGDGVDVQGPWLFASTGHHLKGTNLPKEACHGKGHGLEIFDLSDPQRPVFVSRLDFPPFYRLGNDFWTPRASGDLVFCADTHNGVFAADIADPRRPKIAGRVLFPDAKETAAPSAAVTSLAAVDGVLYVTVSPGGLYRIDCPRARRREHVAQRQLAGVAGRPASARPKRRARVV